MRGCERGCWSIPSFSVPGFSAKKWCKFKPVWTNRNGEQFADHTHIYSLPECAPSGRSAFRSLLSYVTKTDVFKHMPIMLTLTRNQLVLTLTNNQLVLTLTRKQLNNYYTLCTTALFVLGGHFQIFASPLQSCSHHCVLGHTELSIYGKIPRNKSHVCLSSMNEWWEGQVW
jgi:hypothetical protein